MTADDYQTGQAEPGLPDPDYECFEREFEKLTGIRLELYKEKQMKRRINTLIGRKGMDSYEAYLSCLRTNPAELALFTDYITINVTEFFRTPEHWSVLENEVLPVLMQQTDSPLKIWSAACSTGEEAWSLAMSLRQFAGPERFHILATDLDDKVLSTAEKGIYNGRSMETLPDGMRERFFTRENSGWRVSDELRACVEFRKLDLLQDDYPSDCDLIVCRNVLIYFTEEAKNSIYARFQRSLKPDGYLFTGNTEQIIYYKKYGMKKIRGFLYQNSRPEMQNVKLQKDGI